MRPVISHIAGYVRSVHDGKEADDEMAYHVEYDSRLVLSL
jgi:hypothetical protein